MLKCTCSSKSGQSEKKSDYRLTDRDGDIESHATKNMQLAIDTDKYGFTHDSFRTIR